MLKVEQSMEGFLNHDSPECLDALITTIFEEKSLDGNGRVLIEDLVYFSIKDGKKMFYCFYLLSSVVCACFSYVFPVCVRLAWNKSFEF